jgi:hypothetical protein
LVHTVWSTSDGVAVGEGEDDDEAALVLGVAVLEAAEAVGEEEDSGRDAAAFFGWTVTEQPASAATAATEATVAAVARTAPARPAVVPSPFCCAAPFHADPFHEAGVYPRSPPREAGPGRSVVHGLNRPQPVRCEVSLNRRIELRPSA